MRYALLGATGLCLALALPAAAQTSTSGAVQSGPATAKMAGTSSSPTLANAGQQNGTSQNGTSQNGTSQNGTTWQSQPGTQANAGDQTTKGNAVQSGPPTAKMSGTSSSPMQANAGQQNGTSQTGTPETGTSETGTSGQTQPATQASAGTAPDQQIRQHIVQDLKQAGFTNIKVMPELIPGSCDRQGGPPDDDDGEPGFRAGGYRSQ